MLCLGVTAQGMTAVGFLLGSKGPEAMSKNSITDQSNQDASEYNKLNEIIKAGLATFLEAGRALAEVRDRRLYRVEFETWDDYLDKKHALKRQYASRLIKAKEVVSELEAELLPIGNIAVLPSNESQVRPLFRLKSPEERSRAWVKAVEAAGEKPPTAEIVSLEVQAILPTSVRPKSTTAVSEPPGEQGDRKTKSAILHGGAQIPDSLWVEGYIDAETAQRKLDKIGDQIALKPAERLSLQGFFVDLVAGLNRLHEKHPTKEMRKGIEKLFRDTFPNLVLVVSKPGDWATPKPEPAPETE